MNWPYHFVSLNEEQKHQRRIALNTYANIAQSSILTLLLVIQVYHFALWVTVRWAKKSGVDAVSSPRIKEERLGHWNGARGWQAYARRVKWWFGERVEVAGAYLGSRGQVGLAAIWLIWLLVLCFPDTGDGTISPTDIAPTQITYIIPNRLSPPNKTLRNSSSLPAASPLPPGVQIPFLTDSATHPLLARNIKHLPPAPRSNHYIHVPTPCSILPQLLHPVQPPQLEGKGALHNLRHPGRHNLHDHRDDCLGSSAKMELSCLLRRTRHIGDGMDGGPILARLSYPYIHLRDVGAVCAQHYIKEVAYENNRSDYEDVTGYQPH